MQHYKAPFLGKKFQISSAGVRGGMTYRKAKRVISSWCRIVEGKNVGVQCGLGSLNDWHAAPRHRCLASTGAEMPSCTVIQASTVCRSFANSKLETCAQVVLIQGEHSHTELYIEICSEPWLKATDGRSFKNVQHSSRGIS